ncbi:uncharacterized protein LOC122076414 [Macadamia integrifolia]|uniref:uncharacterized protein LOC122076414 n=1 Tax=Macadamia integrifolia TaxID=60698 RepID=UPI001C4E6C86|nr:uncharacterized protein LOC122076414 [Macadamia integrifolia]
MQPKTSHGLCLETVSGYSGLFSVMSTILAGVLGVGLQQISHADAKTADPEVPLPSKSPSSYTDLEKIVKKKRLRLEELLKSRGMFYGSYPRFTVAMKGQKVTIKFQIPPTCEAPHLIVDLLSHLGLKDERGGGSDMGGLIGRSLLIHLFLVLLSTLSTR